MEKKWGDFIVLPYWHDQIGDPAAGKGNKIVLFIRFFSIFSSLFSRVVDPDPDWIQIPRLWFPYWESGSGSRGKKTKKFQWKNVLFSYFLKTFYHWKSTYKIALTTFWKKLRWITDFDFKKIWERNCLRKFCFSLDPDPVLDPDWAKMLDPDPYYINPDPQPCFFLLLFVSLFSYFFPKCLFGRAGHKSANFSALNLAH
jgi:hypothetical protein